MDTLFCIEALEEALAKRQPEIFNSDQGSQFTGDKFVGVLQGRDIHISMDEDHFDLTNKIFKDKL